ncbi:hypothetical protein DM01DRAFT_1361500 [Hesseltinella vesiculosa]|uniref:Autophagy-related protein 11 n=1 Tax=Hesseltinella vesiculosa TaxID=101127 RepID=A0A1X2GSC4_9FUNG|nr:hypothetical protein DM01DRAFT_1361500 [Hesseltinella vesiculosa]
MTSFGQQVKQDQLQDIQRATGNDEYIIICYDRHYLGASQEEISTLLDMDIPSIQPELIPFDPSQQLKSLSRNDSVNNVTQRAELFLDLFAGFNAHSQELMDVIAHHAQLARTMVEEQKAQRMALNVAFENLDMHYLLTQQNFEAFQESADREHDKQITLLKNIDTDANILRTIRIHPELAHFGTSSNTKNRLCLIDFVDMEQLDRSREDASKICQLIEATMQQLRPVVSELKMHQQDLQRQIDDEHDLQSLDTKLVDILETKNKAQFIRDKIKRDIIRIHQRMSPWLHTPLSSFLADLSLDDVSRVSRIDSPSMDTPLTSTRTHPGRQPSFSSTSMGNPKEIFEAIYRLAVIHAEEYLSKLADYETTVRQALLHLVTVKRQSIHSFLKSMNVISHLQSDIMHSQQVLNASKKELAEFQAKHETSQLEATRHILFGYGALLIEIVRRKEFSRILKENAHAITDVLGDFKEKEDHRREYFRHDISNALPFKIPVLNKAAPQCEISASSVEESIPQIAHEDIIGNSQGNWFQITLTACFCAF